MAEFWPIVEVNTGISVPKHLKNILMLNGYDDASSIKSITTDDIDVFEEFVKTEIDDYIRVDDDPKEFYHIFHDKKDKFKIMKGDRVKLMDVVEFVKNKLASEAGHTFFYKSEQILQLTPSKTLPSQELSESGKPMNRSTFLQEANNSSNVPKESNDVKVNTTYAVALNKERRRKKTVKISLEKSQTMEYLIHPIERLMKCDESLHHFFCLLNCIGRHEVIVVEDMRLNRENYCPFKCVLGIGNSIEKIISIIESNSVNLSNIQIKYQEENLPSILEINECNIFRLLKNLVNQRYGCEDEIGEIFGHELLSMSSNILNYIDSGYVGSGFIGLVKGIKQIDGEDAPMEDISTN